MESTGRPLAKHDRIPVSSPDLTALEAQYVRHSIEDNWITQGPFVERAQEMLKKITTRKYVLCTSSGTSALIAALLAIRPEFKWTVAAPALTFAAVHNSITLVGGNLWKQQADKDSWQVPASEWKDVRWDAAIVAPCYGKVEGTDTAVYAGTKDRFKVIEDAAESFGGFLHGTPAGAFGDISCISFYANKVVTAGEGGAVLTDDPEYARRLKTILNHGIDNTEYIPVRQGFNGRMTDMQAAVLCAQLERMPEMVSRRHEILAEYWGAAKGKWLLPTVAPGEIPAPWLFAGVHEHPLMVIKRCQDANIETRPFFPVPSEMKETDWVSQHGLCLPLFSGMTDGQVNRVCEVIRG